MKQSFVFTLILILSFLYLGAQEKTNFTATQLWQMERIGTPVVSPDGLNSLFTLTKYDIGKNESSTCIYLLNNESSVQKQITFTGKESSPFWNPDGTQIGFISRRDDKPAQIYIMDGGWGEARKLTDMPVGVYSPKWFPCGKKIAFAATIHPDYKGDFQQMDKILKDQKENKLTAKVTENYIYRFWDRWLTDGMFQRLFSIELSTGKVTDLMPETSNYFSMMGGASYDISPDGNEIAFSMNNEPAPFEKVNNDIFILTPDGSGKTTNITFGNIADDSDPVYSPDGRFILYGKQNSPHFYADNVQMVVYDRTTRSHSNLTSTIDLSCEQWQWSTDGKTIWFHAETEAKKGIFSIPASGGKHSLHFDTGNNNSLQLSGKNQVVFTHDNLNKPADVYSLDIKGKNLKQLTFFNKAILDSLNLGKIENITFKGADGAEVQMYLTYPPDFDPSKKYPLVLMIHGGPHSTFGDQWHYRWNSHLFAEPGYVVAMPNFHGSTSFGQAFTVSIHGSHADKPFTDIMKATDYMISRGFIDETKMAATGGSYGGYMVSWIAGHSDRFACLVNHAGVYNTHMQFSTDNTAYREHQYNGTPWENFENLQAANPSMFAANFKTPMLIIHGERDYRVPVGQGLLVYGVYKRKGLDARLVYFPDENHWILQPQNSIYWYKELHEWLKRYL